MMKIRTLKTLLFILALSATPIAWADTDSPSVAAEDARLSEELNRLEAGLPAKREELARLRRKWVVVKGRMPTAKEIRKYEEKVKKGEAKVEDNPYMNKSPLSSPGLYREAYYKQLNEIRGDEERIARLKEQLSRSSR